MIRPLAAALCVALAGATGAAQPRPGFRPLAAAVEDARAGRVPLPNGLAEPVTVAFDAEPLARVLDEVARRARLAIAYADDVAAAPRVTLRAERTAAAELLVRATRGTGWSAWVDASGQVVVRRDRRDARDDGGHAPAARASARVSGYVRNAETREVVRHATLAVDVAGGDSVRARGNADGFYFLRLPAGRHLLRVRALGFAPLDTALDVAAPATVELALTPVAVTLASARVVDTLRPADVDPRSPDMSVARLDLPTVRRAPAVLGEVDPIRSLALLPGVSRTSDFSTAFSVRGGGADQNLILLDEATIYNPAHILGFLSVFNADAVDDVTLHKGAIPARYGGRLSSVLDVRQREGNAREYAGTASIGLLSSRASVEGPLPGVGRRGSFLVAARRSYADLFLKAARDTALRDDRAYFYDVNAKANVRLGETGALMASAYVGRDAFTMGPEFEASWGNVSGTLRWNQVVANRLLSKVTAYASDYDYGLRFDLATDVVRWTSRVHARALRVDQTLHLGERHAIEFGGEASFETLRPGDLSPRDTTKVEPVRVPPRHALATAAYLAHEVDVGPRLSLRYGARLSGFARRGTATVYAYEGGTPVVWDAARSRFEVRDAVDSVRHGPGATFARYGALEPRVSARFALGASSSLKASWARTAQYLLLATRTNAPTPLDVWEPVGPHFRPQRADQYAVGWAATPGAGAYEVSVEAYAKRVRNVVDFVDGTDVVLNPRLETGIVQGIARARGVELFARKRGGGVSGWVSYTAGRAEQRFSPAPGQGINDGAWYPTPTDKTHDLSVVALRPLGARWTLGATFVASSGLPTTLPVSRYEVDGLVVAEYGPRNGARLPAYHRLDLAVTRATSRAELQFGVYNAYNRFNAQSLSFRQSTRDPRATEAVQLAIFGLVPSVSYTRRF